MAKQDNKLQMPGAFGGLMRYDEEHASKFMLNPGQVIGLIIALAIFVIALKIFFPIVSNVDVGGISGVPSFVLGLLG
jgi:preprotein translocase subunit Sec61beta